MKTVNLSKHKQLGRQVLNPSREMWEKERENIMLAASYAEFFQNPAMLQHHFGTGDRLLVGASPHDAVWSIGVNVFDPAAAVPSRCRGENLLGQATQKRFRTC